MISLPGLNSENSLFQVGFDAAWAVDVFGGIRRGVESAKANEQAAAAERRGVVLMIAAETARAYLELRGMQQQLQIAETTLEEQRQTLAVTENKQRNGLASDLDVLRANGSGIDRRPDPATPGGKQAIHPCAIHTPRAGANRTECRVGATVAIPVVSGQLEHFSR